MLLTTGTPVMATGGFGAPCINNCILYIIVEKGFDPVNLIVNHVTEDLIRKDISEVSRPGDRCKILVLDAIANEKKRQNLNVSVKVNLGEGSTKVAQQSDGGTGSTSSQDLEWKRQRLGYITNPIGPRAINYMKTMPTFY